MKLAAFPRPQRTAPAQVPEFTLFHLFGVLTMNRDNREWFEFAWDVLFLAIGAMLAAFAV